MAYKENIEKIFLDDIREKKRTGNGVFSRTGKGVKHHMSGIKTPYDFMKAKERRKLNGEVVVSNMYTSILPRDEFKLKDLETQKNMMMKWRELYPNTQIREEMGLANKAFYDLVEALGLPKKPKGHGIRKGRATEPKQVQALVATPQQDEPPKIKPILISNGLHLEYNGEYSADELIKIFTKLQLLVENEENKFTVSISMTERT